MRRFLLSIVLGISVCSLSAQKKIYIPEDLQKMNMESDTAQWSFKRSAETRDLVFFWERGFGHDLQDVPQLDGKPMNVNLSVLMERLQSFYTFFRDSLGFGNPNSNADHYKMMVMLMYSLDGTAYGGTYDDFIGGLWVAPNRIQDKTMNCMAHELGHSFQLQIPADKVGDAWGGSGFYEMTSQWMLWQVNPWWLRDENYHFEAFKRLTHKAYLAMENIYHSPYVIQWWSDLRGRKTIAELYRQGHRGEDPVITYKRMFNMSQQQFCLEMLSGYQHLVDFDFQHARKETRSYAQTWSTRLDTLCTGWLVPKDTLEDYGFHIIPLTVGKKMPRPRVEILQKSAHGSVMWALVGIDSKGCPVYGKPGQKRLEAKDLKKLYLVVMGAPKEHKSLYQPFNEEDNITDGDAPRHYLYRLKY
ncbi:MAG: hypothetical protein K6F89_03365 [Prevotella sp.]|nr:hypothetical protein [Prevotella sp.]